MVLVPLNRRQEIGVVWDHPSDDGVPDRKLKPLSGLIDTPPMRPALRQFVDWVASYTLSSPGEVMAMALRIVAPGITPPPPAGNAPPNRRKTPASPKPARKSSPPWPQPNPAPPADLARAAGVTPSVIRGMADAGLLLPAILPTAPPFAIPDPEHPGETLAPDQQAAAAALRDAVQRANSPSPCSTASPAPARPRPTWRPSPNALRQHRQALVLLPEIALSSQWLERFERRFGVAPAVWHSDLTSRTRRTTWRAVADGAAPVVVGARSALFLPFPDLGLIVIDEEHETAFKQEEGVVYHARDMAVVRARFCAAPAVLVSATPSLETLANVEAGRYRRITLPTRHGGATLPSVAAARPARHPAGPRPLPRARR